MMLRRMTALGGLAVLAACSTPSESSGIVELPPDSFIIEARAPWLAPAVERSLDQAVAHCAGTGRQTELRSTVVNPGSYTVVFRCAGELGAPRQLVMMGRPPGQPVSRAVLEPREGASASMVVTPQPVPLAMVDPGPVAQPTAPRGAAAAGFSAGNPFVGEPGTSRPEGRNPAPAAPPARGVETRPLPAVASPAAPPAAFWQGPR